MVNTRITAKFAGNNISEWIYEFGKNLVKDNDVINVLFPMI